jgi:hypothetical protein
MRKQRLLLLALVSLLCSALPALADEGMWTYDQAPTKLLEERYGFAPDAAWLDHLRLSSVRIGASGSFVSGDGLILTNHHVALGSLQRLSMPEKNYVRDGFHAGSRAEEIKVPGFTVRVLLSIEDVTAAVDGAVKQGATVADAKVQHDGKMALIAQECAERTKLTCDVVTLWGSVKHVLYRYKLYTDVRLVFAPELQAAFFGGDYDNFTYPRYDLDFALFRAYEDGKPAKVEHYLRVEPNGAADGDLIVVSGHPGATSRLETVAMLEYLRDVRFPARLDQLRQQRALLVAYSARGPEQARRARSRLYGVENSLKSLVGEQGGLKDPALMDTKRTQEAALLKALDAKPGLGEYRKAWIDLADAMGWARAHEKDGLYKSSLGSRTLLGTAMQIVRYAEEERKPDADRLEGYHEAELPDLLRNLENPPPIFKDLEEVLLTWELRRMADGLGAADPFVRTVLEGRSPEEAVAGLLAGTKLDDTAFRRELLKDHGKAVAASDDPLLRLARRADPTVRDVQKQFRDHVDAVEEEGLTSVARAGFAAYGADAYPDATGTLRLAFGKVEGYEFATTLVPPFTTFYGLYDRAYSFGNKGDFALPARVAAHKADVNLSTPLNFVSTADITGGNSGSPIVNRAGRLVGLVFDGNQQSHPNSFVYGETEARCVAVDVRAILEALRKIYDAGVLADEMEAPAR